MDLAQCPSCGRGHWFTAVATPGVPDSYQRKPGDVSICLHCDAVNIIGSDLRARTPSLLEAISIAREPGMAALIARHQAMSREQRKRDPDL